MDLAALCVCGGENGTNGCHLAGFSPPYRSDTGIGYASK